MFFFSLHVDWTAPFQHQPKKIIIFNLFTATNFTHTHTKMNKKRKHVCTHAIQQKKIYIYFSISLFLSFSYFHLIFGKLVVWPVFLFLSLFCFCCFFSHFYFRSLSYDTSQRMNVNKCSSMWMCALQIIMMWANEYICIETKSGHTSLMQMNVILSSQNDEEKKRLQSVISIQKRTSSFCCCSGWMCHEIRTPKKSAVRLTITFTLL